MVEVWFIEFLKGLGRFLLNPLFYWIIFLVIIVGYHRIKKERKNFGIKVFELFTEWKGNWVLSLILGLFLSILMIGVGFVLSIETVIVLSIITFLLSLILRFSLLSASYTIGLTYLVILLLPLFFEGDSIFSFDGNWSTNGSGLVILLSLLLIIEAQLLNRTNRNLTYPQLVKGNRGAWIGQHLIHKVTIIPIFLLIPIGEISSFAPFWPFFNMNGEAYGIILFPFAVGFQHVIRGNLPEVAAKKLALTMFWLGIIVLLFAIGSIYFSWLAIVAVVVAIIGREIINYRHRIDDSGKTPYFHQSDYGLKVLGIIPGSPADRLNILVGETIVKVNGIRVKKESEFYEALQKTGAFFKIELLDENGEIRFVQSAIYEGDHYELGLIFPSEPHRKK